MRIGTAWAKALLPVGFMLVAVATARAQYAPGPYGGPGPGMAAPSPYAPNAAPAQYSQPGAPPVFYDQGGYAPPGLSAPPDYLPPEGFADPGAEYPMEGGPGGQGMPFLGQPRAFGTGGIAHPRWFDLSADYMVFTRDNVSQFTPISSLGIGGPTVLSSDHLNFGTSSGFRVTGNYLVGAGRNIEASYFGTFNFAAGSQVADAGGTLQSAFSGFGAGAPTAFDNASLHTIAYSTNLHSAELNLRQRYVSPNGRIHTSLLAGARYVCIDEDFQFDSLSGLGAGQYIAGTSNDLIGFQLGGDLCVAFVPRVKFGVEGKAGVFGNDAQVRNRIRETAFGGATVITQEAASANNASFVGEAGAFMIVHLHPRFNLKAGYQCLVATGLALGPENLNPDPNFGVRPVTVDVGGHAFYHGGQAGFEFIY